MSDLQWWCAAQTVAWSWEWRPYPGVWLFLLGLAGVYATRVRHAGGAIRATGVAGFLLLWIALDWPVGALGGGYLASLHAVQFLLVSMAAPPLLLLGLPRGTEERATEELRAGAAARVGGGGSSGINAGGGASGAVSRFPGLRVGHPLVALAGFTGIIYFTHLPAVSDALMASQWGAFVIDVLWLAGGTWFWWPVVGPGVWPGFTAPLRMGYLFAILVFMTAPGAMITFSDLPLYATYELAPRVGGLSVLEDQRLAGLLMKAGGGFIVWIAISILFYRWHREENRLLDKELGSIHAPADRVAAAQRRE